MLKPLITIILLFPSIIYSQNVLDNNNTLKFKGKYEFGLTPNFSYYKNYKISDNDTGFFAFQSKLSLQVGYEIHKNTYINALVNYFHANTDVNFYPKYNAFAFGVLFNYKFINNLFESKTYELYNKQFKIRLYPELFAMISISNLHQEENQLPESDTKFKYFQYSIGTGIPIYLNKHFNLQFSWQILFQPNIFKNYVNYRFIYTQIVFKL